MREKMEERIIEENVEESKEEAIRFQSEAIGTEHMLLAILREPDSVAGMERSPELVHDTFGGFCIGTCFKKLCNYQCNGSDRFHGKYHRAGR